MIKSQHLTTSFFVGKACGHILSLQGRVKIVHELFTAHAGANAVEVKNRADGCLGAGRPPKAITYQEAETVRKCPKVGTASSIV